MIRFDDLIVTAFELVLNGEWRYLDCKGLEKHITRKEINRLYKGGRVAKVDVVKYTGSWIPVKVAA